MAAGTSIKIVGLIGLILMTVTSVMIGLYAVWFQIGLAGDPEFYERFAQTPIRAAAHVIGGGIVLLLGAFQFWPSLRRNYTQLHRWSGRIYLSFVAIGGVGGLMLAPISDGGVVAHFGFGTLAVLWLFSGWQAYAAIRQGDVANHKAWMMRNFSMAFGAVTLRIYLGLFAAADVPFEEAYPTVAWISWVPNLILVEWYLAMAAASKGSRQIQADNGAPQGA